MRDWSKTAVIKKWVSARKVEGEPLRKTVWDSMGPLRKALRYD